MSKNLNVLYAADNNYAPFLGVSMYSLFENNKEFENITVYAVLDNVAEENINKLKEIAQTFSRQLIIVYANDFNEQLKKLDVPMYRGNYTTNYRLFFDKIISKDVERVFYIDCDTIICKSLSEITDCDFENNVAGVVLDSLGSKYKKIVGFSSSEPYFNAGVLIIDVKNWQNQNITEKIMNYIQNVRSKYCNPDQDLLNINLKGKVKILGPEYNFQPVHRAYSDFAYNITYGFKNYYSKEQINNAKKNPVILHTYRFLGQFPWHKNNSHPDTIIFDKWLSKTPWADYEKKISNCNSPVFKIERIQYKILPKVLFLILFTSLQKMIFKKQNKKILKSLKKN